MMGNKYYIYMTDQKRFVPVRGHKVVFKLFEQFEFFIHQADGNKKVFTISEKSSGSRVALGLNVRDTYEEAENMLLEMGPARIKSAISKAVLATLKINDQRQL